MLKFLKPRQKEKPTRVLVIDDEVSFTRMVKVNLEDSGAFAVETVNESPQAVEKAREFRPHIIFLDVVMPEADGGDVATALRASSATKNIPIVFVSAMIAQKESKEGLFESGGEHFLAKPVSAETMVQVIQRLARTENEPD